MADNITLKRIKDHDQAAVAADVAGGTTQIPIDDAGYSEGKIINALELTKAVADIADANTTAGVPATRDGTGKIPASQLPASADVAKGDWDADNSTLGQLSDGTGTAGWYYDVVDANGGTIDQGAGTLAINGASVAVGDRIKYDGANWFLIPQVANIFKGAATAAQAAAAGDHYLKVDVNDRQLNKAPSNAIVGDGVDDYVSLNSSLLQFGDSLSDIPCGESAIIEIDDLGSIFVISAKATGSAPNNERTFTVKTDGKLEIKLFDSSTAVYIGQTGSTVLVVGRRYHVVWTYDGSGTSAGIKLYVNGVAETLTLTELGSYTAMHASGASAYLFRFSSNYGKGKIYSYAPWNRELSAADVALLAANGNQPGPADKWAGATATSGTLTVGQRYRITTFVAGDDFTNVGAGSNATGVEFVATGTTPTTWTNSSTLTDIGAIADYAFDAIDAVNGVLPDRSSNGLNGSITDATKVREDRGLHIDAESPAADEKLLTVSVAGVEKASIDEDGDAVVQRLNIANIPTSSGGLSSGDVWNDSGTLKIVT